MGMKLNEVPPVEELRKHLRVDDQSRLWKKTKRYGWVLAAKDHKGKGYFQLSFGGKQYLAHRIIWAMHHGRSPTGVIDHINGKPWDNRIENLREATHAQNRWNSNTRGKKAECVFKCAGGYRARVTANYQSYITPPFPDREFAALVASEMRRKYHGEFAFANRT